jgi:hypothetical protein
MADALNGLKLGNAFRRLGKKPGREATRALSMAIADYVAETFETDAVRGAIASRAVQYTAKGPWSAGTTAVLLADSAGNDGGAPGQSTIARGGPGALAEALAAAARSFGVEIRTGAEVAMLTADQARERRRPCRRLRDPATGFVSAADPSARSPPHRPGGRRAAPALAGRTSAVRGGSQGEPRAPACRVVRRRRGTPWPHRHRPRASTISSTPSTTKYGGSARAVPRGDDPVDLGPTSRPRAST